MRLGLQLLVQVVANDSQLFLVECLGGNWIDAPSKNVVQNLVILQDKLIS